MGSYFGREKEGGLIREGRMKHEVEDVIAPDWFEIES